MASIIADGVHVDFNILEMSYKIMPERLFLITDATTSCTIGPYQHRLAENIYVTPEGTISGAAITLLKAVQNCAERCGIPLSEALNMASARPAKVLGQLEKRGEIAIGKLADFLLLTDELNLQKVFVAGVEHLIDIN